MVLREGWRDLAREMLRESLSIPKVSNIPSARITLSCTENHLVIVLYNNYIETTENVIKIIDEMSNSHNNRELPRCSK